MSFTIEHKWMVIDKQFILRVNYLNELDEEKKCMLKFFKFFGMDMKLKFLAFYGPTITKIGRFSHLTSPT